MRLLIKQCLAGVNYSFTPGQVAEFEPDEAARLVESGIAEIVEDDEPKVEQATSRRRAKAERRG